VAWTTETSAASRGEAFDLDQGVSAYVAAALDNNPEIRAAFERWQASVHGISRARRLPEPMLEFGYGIGSSDTRLGLQQAFPWPTKLTAGADAASARARALQREVEAQALTVKRRVATAYWDLWQIRSTTAILHRHLDVLRGLSESVGARISTGMATLADLQQIDLAAARLEDTISGMNEAERTAEAALRATIGVQGELAVPTSRPPEMAALPAATTGELAHAARTHPMIASLGLMAEAAESTARAEAADRFPGFTIGAEWMRSGGEAMTGGSASGRDSVIVGVGIMLPVWQRNYRDSVASARADAQAELAAQRALSDRAIAELESALSGVRDAVRRVGLYRNTLFPQAESVYESVLGAYTAGLGSVAQTLLAQRDLLELRIELDRARADHARAWARLEDVTGREVEPASDANGNRGDQKDD
jgi:outer membrane protein TolC